MYTYRDWRGQIRLDLTLTRERDVARKCEWIWFQSQTRKRDQITRRSAALPLKIIRRTQMKASLKHIQSCTCKLVLNAF